MRARPESLAERTDTNKVMVNSWIFDQAAWLRSLELVAEAQAGSRG